MPDDDENMGLTDRLQDILSGVDVVGHTGRDMIGGNYCGLILGILQFTTYHANVEGIVSPLAQCPGA